MPPFRLVSDYAAKGDQPRAIRELTRWITAGRPDVVLLGVTGSGKTFTVASVIEQVQRPTLVISPNKTLEEIEREYIITVLDGTGWRIEGQHGAARILGLHPSTLRTRMAKLGVQKPHVSPL